jgi:imidazolonepropionase-like amidohydrolase
MTAPGTRGRFTALVDDVARSLLFAILVPLLACSDPNDPRAGPVAITNATLIDGTGSPARAATTILIEDGRIAAIGPRDELTPPRGAQVIDGTGTWVTPGLIDTHTHMPPRALQDVFLRTLLSFGITTARSTAAVPEGGTELRARIESGEQPGPRFLTAGRLIDGPGTVHGDIAVVVTSETQVRAEVARQAEQGVDFIKLYVGLDPVLVRAAIEAAHARGLAVIGHLGRTTWPSALELGIDALTHSCFWGMAHSLVPRADSARFSEFYQPGRFDPDLFAAWRASFSLTDARFVAFRERAVQNRVAIDPNLVLCEAVVRGQDQATFDRLQTALDVQTPRFPHPYSATWTAAQRAQAELAFAVFLDVVAELHHAGVLITVGTDTMNPWMTPGAAFHRELELLHAAGITPADVIVIATRNGAESLGILSETGTVEVGKAADLLVLRRDPLANISNTREVELIVRGGAVFEPSSLRTRR